MDFLDLKFSENDFLGKDVSSLPDRVVGKAEYLKKMFDNVAKNELALGRFNALLDELDRRSQPAYFSAIGTNQVDVTSIVNQNVDFPDVLVNTGGFVFEGNTHIKIPETGIYMIAFSAHCFTGSGKPVRFMLNITYGSTSVPCYAGCTTNPATSYSEPTSFATAKRLRKNEIVYLTMSPLGTIKYKVREICVLRLKD